VDGTGLCDMDDADLVQFADALLAGAARQPPCAELGTDLDDELPAPDTPASCGIDIDVRPVASSICRCDATNKLHC